MQVPLNLDAQTLMKLTFVEHHEDFRPTTTTNCSINHLKAIFERYEIQFINPSFIKEIYCTEIYSITDQKNKTKKNRSHRGGLVYLSDV